MMFYTHISFALLSSLIALKFLNISNPYIFILVACFVALFPDIDEKNSKLGRKVKIISKIFSHRGILHSIFPIILLFFLFNYFNYSIIAYGILVGYLSHLLIDSFTLQGINFLHPISSFRISGFVKSGGFLEVILFLVLIGFDIFYMIKMVL